MLDNTQSKSLNTSNTSNSFGDEKMKLFEISNPVYWRDLMKVLATVNNEINFTFSYEGIKVLTMDTSHCVLIDFFIPREVFDRYDVEDPETVCLNTEDVNKVLKKVNKRDAKLSLEYTYSTIINEDTGIEKKEDEKVTFIFKSDIIRKKILETFEALDDEPPIPKIRFKSSTRLLLSTLKRILDDFKSDCQYLKIKADSEQIVFSNSGYTIKEITSLERGNDNILEHRVVEDSKAMYNFDYLYTFVKEAVKISEVATLHFSTELPLMLDVELRWGHLRYYVAPGLG